MVFKQIYIAHHMYEFDESSGEDKSEDEDEDEDESAEENEENEGGSGEDIEKESEGNEDSTRTTTRRIFLGHPDSYFLRAQYWYFADLIVPQRLLYSRKTYIMC